MALSTLWKNLSIASLGIMSLASAEEDCTPVYLSDCDCVSITPAAGPGTICDWNFFVTADFIYWTVRQDGMFYAVSGVGKDTVRGKVHDLDWKTEPGFKIGLGLNLPHDGWDVFADYTWIRSSIGGSTSNDPTKPLVSYWSINGDALTGLSETRADWKIQFHDVRLELGRNSYISQYFKLRIHAGLEFSWIDQAYNVEQIQLADGSMDRLELGQDFWGVGLRAGLNAAWQFTSSFSFYGDLSVAILWGEFDLTRKDQHLVRNVATTNIYTGIDAKTFEPVLNLDAGLRWDCWFCDCSYHTSLQIGWEHQLWILQNEFIKVPTETDHIGDLVLQGLTIRARFDF